MPTYNGWRSWNAWNVYTWIANTEALYKLALECLDKCNSISKATDMFVAQVGVRKTSDGARFNKTCIGEALRMINSEK